MRKKATVQQTPDPTRDQPKAIYIRAQGLDAHMFSTSTMGSWQMASETLAKWAQGLPGDEIEHSPTHVEVDYPWHTVEVQCFWGQGYQAHFFTQLSKANGAGFDLKAAWVWATCAEQA